MGLINIVLKAFILVLDLRDTYDALDSVKLEEIGRNEREVLVRNAQDGTRQMSKRRRVGRSKRKAAVKSALTTVLVWNLFHKVEPFCDRTIAWFVPFYDSFKTLFLIWMLFTRSYGASILVYRFLAPMVRPYENIIEGIFEITVALFGWMASVLVPVLERLTPVLQLARSLYALIPVQVPAEDSATGLESWPPAETAALPRPASRTSTTEKAKKKPPPPASPARSIKASSASVAPIAPTTSRASQSRSGTAAAQQTLTKKASQSNLAATRKVLQELPVPRHAFDTNASSFASTTLSATAKSTSKSPAATANGPGGKIEIPVVKTEPLDPISGTPGKAATPTSSNSTNPVTLTTNLGPPPTPPTGLRNYAFIPGMTPQKAGPSTLVSPTPRFPGGFSFSFAAPQATTWTGLNPFQSQLHVPATSQMAPSSLSSQVQGQVRPLGGNVVGVNSAATNNVMTHENVPAANDDRIVPPPNATGTLRKAASFSRALKSKAAFGAERTAAASHPSSSANGKKRSRLDHEVGEDTGENPSTQKSTSPRKRARAAPSKVAVGKDPTGKERTASDTVKARGKGKATNANGKTSATAGKDTARKKAVVNGVQKAAEEASAAGTSTRHVSESASSVAEAKIKSKSTGSPRKKAKANATATAARTGAGLSKATAQRASSKRTPATSESRGGSLEPSEASEPPQRLTRSRTKQNLAG